jgi:hypothetical protein
MIHSGKLCFRAKWNYTKYLENISILVIFFKFFGNKIFVTLSSGSELRLSLLPLKPCVCVWSVCKTICIMHVLNRVVEVTLEWRIYVQN